MRQPGIDQLLHSLWWFARKQGEIGNAQFTRQRGQFLVGWLSLVLFLRGTGASGRFARRFFRVQVKVQQFVARSFYELLDAGTWTWTGAMADADTGGAYDLPIDAVMDAPEQGIPEPFLYDLTTLHICAEEQEVQSMAQEKHGVRFAHERSQAVQEVDGTLLNVRRTRYKPFSLVFKMQHDCYQGYLSRGGRSNLTDPGTQVLQRFNPFICLCLQGMFSYQARGSHI
jgi:hypothetical protein